MISSAERLRNSGSFSKKKTQSYPIIIKLQRKGAQIKRILWKFPSDCAFAQP